jgi:uncharacterized membrane protein YhaH (DUF805 family)
VFSFATHLVVFKQRFRMLVHAKLMQIVKLTGFTSIAVVVIHIALTVRRESAAFLIV